MTKFPMKYFQEQELENRGVTRGLVHFENNSHSGTADVLTFMWMDCEHRYFVATSSSSSDGIPYSSRVWWHQVDETPDAPPERVKLTILKPKAVEVYFEVCGQVDLSTAGIGKLC